MALTCPRGDFEPPECSPDEEIALFLEHLGSHYPILDPLFKAIAAMMRSLPVPLS